MQDHNESWSSGVAYERFMGRWSELIARKFIDWLAVSLNSIWLDIGCGTGSLTKIILETSRPKEIISIDSSTEFISYAQRLITNPVVSFQVGRAQALELESNSVDALVSGIMLNFIPNPETALQEMIRVVRPGGTVGIFLWDYAEGMEMLRYFWDAAIELSSAAIEYDEGTKFPLCRPGQLERLVKENELKEVEATQIEVTTKFNSFEDYWIPFLGNVGPAPSYCMKLNEKDRWKLEIKLRDKLPIKKDGSISLIAKAWAVKGKA